MWRGHECFFFTLDTCFFSNFPLPVKMGESMREKLGISLYALVLARHPVETRCSVHSAVKCVAQNCSRLASPRRQGCIGDPPVWVLADPGKDLRYCTLVRDCDYQGGEVHQGWLRGIFFFHFVPIPFPFLQSSFPFDSRHFDLIPLICL